MAFQRTVGKFLTAVLCGVSSKISDYNPRIKQEAIYWATQKSWSERLFYASLSGAFTDEDKIFAASWATCAVGEKCHNKLATHGTFAISPLSGPPGPLKFVTLRDRLDMERWGMAFMHAVEADKVEAALAAYGKINDISLPREAFEGTMSESIRECE